MCTGARTLAEVEAKCRFAFIPKEQIAYDPKAVQKVLVKDGGQAMLPAIGARLQSIPAHGFHSAAIEQSLRGLAEEKKVGLGKIA